MKKNNCLVLRTFLMFISFTGSATHNHFAPQTDSLLIRLNKVLENSEEYTEAKLGRIEHYHRQLRSNPDKEQVFTLLQNLSEEYKTFVYDSAFTYIQKMLHEAYRQGDAVKIAYAKTNLGFILLSSGMFKETLDSLNTLSVMGMPDSIKVSYYSILARAYYDLGDFDRDRFYTPSYVGLGNTCIDSALALCKPDDYQYLYLRGLKNLKNENTSEALADLTRLLKEYPLTYHQLAVTASTLSYFYTSRGEPEKAIDLLAQAAIADIKSATKETAAMSSLAELLYQKGDIANAYNYIQQAMKDAVFYGARQRKVQVGSILPVIAAAKLTNVEEQRKLWLIYSTVITVLSILVIVFSIIIFKQLRKRKIAEKALKEANKIKEEYIGYYFNINSEYLGKIETFKKSIEMKLMTKKTEDIRFIVNNINPRKEREELYHGFDKIFLKLFPDFVTVFNSYFKEEDRMVLKEGQLLNTELRIFALIRMGIHDPEKIAKILDYSINTIYNYKARVKSKSIIPNEEFEEKIMLIHAL
jgi:tetratricopeptide (TPR) repeat protein